MKTLPAMLLAMGLLPACGSQNATSTLKVKPLVDAGNPEVPQFLPDALWQEAKEAGAGDPTNIVIFKGKLRGTSTQGIFAVNATKILATSKIEYMQLENPEWSTYFTCLEKRDQRSKDQRKVSYIKTIDYNFTSSWGEGQKLFMTTLHLDDREFGGQFRISGHNPPISTIGDNFYNFTNPNYPPFVLDFDQTYSPVDHFVAFVSTEDANREEIWVTQTEKTAKWTDSDFIKFKVTQQPNGWTVNQKHPRFSPKGNNLVYSSNLESSHMRLWIVRDLNPRAKSFSSPVALTDDRVIAEYPIWLKHRDLPVDDNECQASLGIVKF